MPVSILLFGGRGQLGWELQRALGTIAPLVVVDGHADPADPAGPAGPNAVDFARPDSAAAAVRRLRPAVIVNAAAYTDVDGAEREPDLAHAVNAMAPGALAEAARAADAWLVHFSSDYVFDGQGSAAFDEDAAPGPLNAYGRSKLAGEQMIRASGCRHLILRTSWLHAARGRNFVRTILKLAETQDRIDVVDDQVGSPTGADLLADITAVALRAVLARAELGGTYHATAAGHTSWHGCACLALATARRLGRPLRATAASIQPVASSARPGAARRPLNSRLSTDRLRRTFGLHLPPWQPGVERTVSELPA